MSGFEKKELVEGCLIAACVIVVTIVVGYIAHYALDARSTAVHQEKIACMEKAQTDVMLAVCNGVRS